MIFRFSDLERLGNLLEMSEIDSGGNFTGELYCDFFLNFIFFIGKINLKIFSKFFRKLLMFFRKFLENFQNLKKNQWKIENFHYFFNDNFRFFIENFQILKNVKNIFLVFNFFDEK